MQWGRCWFTLEAVGSQCNLKGFQDQSRAFCLYSLDVSSIIEVRCSRDEFDIGGDDGENPGESAVPLQNVVQPFIACSKYPLVVLAVPFLFIVCFRAASFLTWWLLRDPLDFLSGNVDFSQPSLLLSMFEHVDLGLTISLLLIFAVSYVLGLGDLFARILLQANLSSEVGASTTISKLRLVLHWDATILTIEGMKIVNFQGFRRDTIIEVDFVRWRFDLWRAIFSNHKIVYETEIQGMRLHVDLNQDLELNLQRLAASKVLGGSLSRTTSKNNLVQAFDKGLQVAFGIETIKSTDLLGDQFMARLEHYVHTTDQAGRRMSKVDPTPAFLKSDELVGSSLSRTWSVGKVWIRGLAVDVDFDIWRELFALNQELLEEASIPAIMVSMDVDKNSFEDMGYDPKQLSQDKLGRVMRAELGRATAKSLAMRIMLLKDLFSTSLVHRAITDPKLVRSMSQQMNLAPLVSSLSQDPKFSWVLLELGLSDFIDNDRQDAVAPEEILRRVQESELVRPLLQASRKFLMQIIKRDRPTMRNFSTLSAEMNPTELDLAMLLAIGRTLERKESFERMCDSCRSIPLEPVLRGLARSSKLTKLCAQIGLDLPHLVHSTEGLTIGSIFEMACNLARDVTERVPDHVNPLLGAILKDSRREQLESMVHRTVSIVQEIQHGNLRPLFDLVESPKKNQLLELIEQLQSLGFEILVDTSKDVVGALRLLPPVVNGVLDFILGNLSNLPAIAYVDEFEGTKYSFSNVRLSGVSLQRDNLEFDLLGLLIRPQGVQMMTDMGVGTVLDFDKKYRTYEVALEKWTLANGVHPRLYIPVDRAHCSKRSSLLRVSVRDVSAVLNDVSWSYEQSYFPFWSDAGLVNAEVRDLSIDIECGLRRARNVEDAAAYQLCIENDSFEVGDVSFEFHESVASVVYNAAASILVHNLREHIIEMIVGSLRQRILSALPEISRELENHWPLILQLRPNIDLETLPYADEVPAVDLNVNDNNMSFEAWIQGSPQKSPQK